MEPKVIKSERDYKVSLSEVERLALSDPSPDSPDGARLELIALLVEDYEKSRFSFESPDPIEAIEFRMNEQGLRQVDLVPYFGSRSRASEVLGRKRPLTVQMIRDLSVGLGIPADRLVAPPMASQGDTETADTDMELDWTKFPVREMKSHGYFADLTSSGKSLSDLARDFFTGIIPGPDTTPAFTRKGLRGDAVTPKSRYGLLAWKARVLQMARMRRRERGIGRFNASALDSNFLSQVVGLSWHPDGIRMACDLVEGIGITVIVEQHLSATHLDGAAILDNDGSAVIGLTLRFNRVDSFWFTFMHELAHVMKHLSLPGDAFLDRLEDCEANEALEIEANRIARDSLVSRAAWRRSELVGAASRERILQVARELKIHPAIVAGRVRRETGNYRVFGDLLGEGEVQRQFSDRF